MSDEETGQRVQENSHPWSGAVEKVGVNLLVPWIDEDYREAGAVWIRNDRAAEMAAALLARVPSTPEFVTELMRQALFGVVPPGCVDEAARRAGKAAELAIEHAIGLTVRQGVAPKRRARKPSGMTNVIPAGEHEGIL